RGPQTASLNDFVRDYADVDDEAAAEMVSDRKEAAFSDGKILIYNYEQLSKIGSGESREYEDGETATYAADAEYMLARDIPLPRHTVWQLPEGFKGKITGKKTENAQLYDKAADRIYLYNPYQLAVTAMEDRESQPVMSGDADASTFGTGKVICTDEEEKCYLTYGDNRNYVVAAGFQSEVTGKSPSVLSKKSADAVGASGEDSVGAQEESTVGAAAFDGRDFDGQVTKKIGDTTYILIGNAKQLRAIGTNKNVLPAIYQISAVAVGTTAIIYYYMYITLIFFFRAQDSLMMISSITSVYLPCSIKEFLRSIRDFSTSERSSFVRYIWYFGVLIKSLPSAIIICQKLSSLNFANELPPYRTPNSVSRIFEGFFLLLARKRFLLAKSAISC
ncbi:MAG: hypothetical protein II074_02770, partial [Ruminococcus sp.]|nr:hypothetical protein [Ruminococcus sp.]